MRFPEDDSRSRNLLTKTSTGRILHALGNVHWALADYERSSHFHQRALQHYINTIGKRAHRVGDMCFKVAQHYMRKEENSEAQWVPQSFRHVAAD